MERQEVMLKRMAPHTELICAIICGVLIFIGWIVAKSGAETTSIILFVLGSFIGGYAKAKEGIADTIEEKTLNVEMLMIFAAIGASIIGFWAEGAILIFIFALSGALETYTMNKSNKEISSLLDLQPQEATRLVDGMEKKVSINDLAIGDLIFIKPGERIPADGKIVRGETSIDESAITGEPIPVIKGIGDDIFAGTVNIRGSMTVEITKHSSETLFQKIIKLVQSAQSEKSPSQLFIEKFENTYVKGVLLVVGAMMFLPHFLFGWDWTETFYRAMILLVVASPCALVAAITPATLSAISNGAKKGILVKGGVHLENLASLQAIAFDKTGTLTKGKPVVTDVHIREGENRKEILQLTGSIEKHSTHPLADALVKYIYSQDVSQFLSLDSVEDVSGFGVKSTINGQSYKIGKADFVGTEEANLFQDSISSHLQKEGKTLVYVKDAKGILALFALKDVIRQETAAAMKKLNDLGIKTIMITGDSEETAKVIAAESNIHEYYASCLPEKKVEIVKTLKEKYGKIAMIGDGINDAPALATANVGIAMGEGTDVALETADIVLMKNELSRLAEVISLSKRMNKIIKQNIIISLTVITLLICSNFLQFLHLPLGVIGHEGSTILVILNGLRLLK
jgi:Zn2+/Cd2+-exporting ATPase